MEPPFDIVTLGLPDPRDPHHLVAEGKRYSFHVAADGWLHIPMVIEEHGAHGIQYTEHPEQEGWLASFMDVRGEWYPTNPGGDWRVTPEQVEALVALLSRAPGFERIRGERSWQDRYIGS